VRITNHLHDEPGVQEILVAGHESNIASIKLYQESNDRYTRIDIPSPLLSEVSPQELGGQPFTVGLQGLGTSGKNVVVAGGSATSHMNGYMPSKKVFMVNAQTKQITVLPDLVTPRAAPMIGSSANGRYIVIAGGVVFGGRSQQSSKAIEVIDRVTKQHVDLAAKYPGLAEGLPEGRFSGSVVWVQEKGVDRIFFIGGATSFTRQGAVSAQEPTKAVHFYDVTAQKWGEMELPTPRMGAAIAIRHLPGGQQEIVVAGGGTGTTQSRPLDPQIYAVERIDPKALTVKFGESVPEQAGLYVTNTERSQTAMDWSSNAMVLLHGKAKTKADRVTTGARFFGFSNAYKTEDAHTDHRAASSPSTIVNVQNNTTINETTIHETKIHETTINETKIHETNVDVQNNETLNSVYLK